MTNNCSWEIEKPMIVTIRDENAEILMNISICEIIESSSRTAVLNHVAACDNTPWLIRWNNERHESLVKILKDDY